MNKITKMQYEFALARVEQLLPIVDDNMPANDKQAVELSIMSDIAQPYSTQLTLVDSVYGIDSLAALLILAEIGPAPHLHFSSSDKLCSWAGLSPRNDQSAGSVKSRKILPGNPYI